MTINNRIFRLRLAVGYDVREGSRLLSRRAAGNEAHVVSSSAPRPSHTVGRGAPYRFGEAA